MTSAVAAKVLVVLGLLSTAPPPAATQALATIVAVGDSTPAGTLGYSHWLGRANAAWRVLNRGGGGQRTDQTRARFKADVLDIRPDLVIIVAGAGDIREARPPDEVKADLMAMYDLAKGAGIAVVAGSMMPFDAATPEQNSAMSEVNAWMALMAERDPNITFADTRAAVAAPGQPDLLASSPDGLRPSPDGYQRMADVLRPVVEAALKSRRPR